MKLSTCLFALCALAGVAAPALAQPRCFGGSEPAAAPLTLGDRVRLDTNCQYALDANGPWRSLTNRDTVVDVLAALGWRDGMQATAYGRRTDAPTEVSSVFVDHCTDYVLQAGGAFRVRPGARTDALVVERTSGATSCGVDRIALTFECEGSGARRATLPIGAQAVELPECGAGWRVEAAAQGEPSYPLGRLAAGGETPLQRRLRDGGSLLRPDWEGERGLRFVPTETDADAWAELRTAFAAGHARLVRKRGATAATACHEESADVVPLVVTGGGVAFDEGWLAAAMRDLYGADGVRFAPSLSMLRELADELHLCLAGTYGARGAREGTGLAFAQAASAQELVTRYASAELCVTHVAYDVTPNGLVSHEGTRQCVAVSDGALLAANAGAVLELPEGSVACNGNTPIEASEGRLTLTRGLVDVRVGTRGGCATFETASLGRVGVVDPGHDWIPAGLERGGREAPADVPAWSGVFVDDPQSFAFVRRRDDLRFRMTSPEGFASAWNHPARGAATAVGQHAPVVGDESGRFGHARPSAFVTRLTKDATCPVGADEVRTALPAETVVDGVVHAHLVLDDGRAPRCLAHARFRAREPRVVSTLGRSERRQLRIGFLGDARLGVFFSEPQPAAIGALLPIFYTDLHLKAGFLFEVSVPITAAIAWEDGRASRVGPALMVAMNWGYPEIAPRLFTFGVMVHAPWPHPDDTVWSFFGGINVTSLVDLLGGR
ncbi:MAG: hypothetical protein H6720_20300 [Sandaracinus sp.]|nr:hypothetical protein [Sandaracinus sp.]